MSTPRIPLPARVYLSVLASGWDGFWPGLRTELTDLLGEVDYEAGPMPFAHTSYYEQELGGPVERRVLSFSRLLPQDELADVKLATNAIEDRYANGGKRSFNLDPGLVTLERLILATGKGFTHRVYQTKGIWADLTLIWQGNRWRAQPWTFSDYAAQDLQDVLTDLRDKYKETIDPLLPRGERKQDES